MIFTKSSPKRIEKVSSDNAVIGYDLLSALTYMSVLVIGGMGREQLLAHCSQLKLKTSVFFEYVHALAKYMGAEYTYAFQLVSDRARASRVKSVLLRFAAAISSGESESRFIIQETRSEAERYRNEYDRSVENLKKWTDAYAAILVSVTLIMLVSLVSTMMGNLGPKFIVLMGFTLFCITTIGVYVIYKVAPMEETTYSTPEGMPRARRLARISLLILGPTGLSVGMLLGIQFDFMVGSAIFFACVGVCLLPPAVYAWLDDRNVSRLDSMFPTFIHSVGNVAGATGLTIAQALRRIDSRSMGSLEPHIDNLRVRLGANLPPEKCWQAFREETGSDLANRASRMLVDGASYGGRADQVGEICFDFALNITQLRAKRSLTSATFSFLTIPLHATMVFVLVFVLQIVSTFNTELADAYTRSGIGVGQVELSDAEVDSDLDLPEELSVPAAEELVGGVGLFAVQDLTLVNYTVVMVIFTLTMANAFAPLFAAGGSKLKIATYLGPMCLVSALILGVVPYLSAAVFAD